MREPVGHGNGAQRLTPRDGPDDLSITAGGTLAAHLAATNSTERAAARLRERSSGTRAFA